MIEKLMSYAGWTIVLALLAGVGLGAGELTPDHAVVYTRDAERTYISPPCFAQGDYSQIGYRLAGDEDPMQAGFNISTYRDARSLKYKSDDICRNAGGFGQDMTLAESLIFGHPLFAGNRWEQDGTWNW
jgi:hypothetical protein